MADLTTEYCLNNLTTYDGTNPEAIITLTDERNNQDYQVARLADGKCWMLNNLKISLADVANNPSLSNPGINTTALAAHAVPDNIEIGYIYDSPRYYEYASSSNDINDETFYGYYYNWCAAKGGTADSCTPNGTYPVANSADICPVGWRMPTGGPTGEFAILNGSMFNNTPSAADTSTDSAHAANFQFTGPFRGAFAGYLRGSSWNYQGDNGNVWSGSFDPSSPNFAFNLYFYSSFVNPGSSGNRNNGLAVRCLL